MIDGDYVAVDYTLPNAGTIAMWYYVDPYYDYQSIFDVIGEDTSVDPPVPYSANVGNVDLQQRDHPWPARQIRSITSPMRSTQT